MEDYESRKVANAPKIQEQHSYVDVLAARLNEVDQRLLKYSIDMNIKHEPAPQDPLKHKRTEIELNRQSTMISLAKAKELEKKDQLRK